MMGMEYRRNVSGRELVSRSGNSEEDATRLDKFVQEKADSRLDSAPALKECCIESICRHLPYDTTKRIGGDVVVVVGGSSSSSNVTGSSEELGWRSSLEGGGSDMYIPGELCDKLLETLGDKGKIDDRTLSLFDARVTNLRHVRLRNASRLTMKGLRILREHKISELEATRLTVTVNDLIGCQGEWTLQNLRSLNVSHSTFMNSSKFCVVVSLHRLRNLQSLNVSYTEFNKHGLEIVAEDLPLLENLDISCTKVNDISPLRKCRHRLVSLTMYNLQNCNYNTVISVVMELSELRHLDLSIDLDRIPLRMLEPLRFHVAGLLSHANWRHLVSLDVSGKEDVGVDNLSVFLDRHPMLRFLGLVQTSVCEDESFWRRWQESFRGSLVVTGNGNEAQIVEALKRYPNRPLYIQKSLYHLFRLTQAYTEPRVDIIKLILPGMQAHPKQLSIQMAATACLYNLSKGEMGQKIHPKWLRQIVELTMVAMENFPTHLQLQKNTLLTLCSDRILQEVTFDKYKCARLVMDCLCAFDDSSMNRMCVAICSVLAAKISTLETSQLGAKPLYMKKLLSIVKAKVEEGVVDITMKFTLSALWNLTDESPETCNVFLDEEGLYLFLDVLERFPEDSAVETKVLGLVNNIAEVKQLRASLMIDKFVSILRCLLRSSHIDVSYFAAGIIAHLASDGNEAWRLQSVCRRDILSELSQVVCEWKTPESEMVAYRSFNPFFPLLSCQDSYEVQLWAVWAMQHVCNRNHIRYCPMLIAEGGVELLHNLYESDFTHEQVRSICKSILAILEEKGPFYVLKESNLSMM